MTDADRPIGVFDSGVGGVTVLRELVYMLPTESFIYVGDTARVPYGTKSAETVTRYSIEITNYLITRHDIKMLVVACNTASSLSLPTLRKIYKIPVIGMVEPCVQRAASLGRRGRIGVIGTTGTIRSGAYERALREALPGADIRSIACPLFVALAEEGLVDHPVARGVVEEYLAPFRGDAAGSLDALILGCTHYPILKRPIQEYLGEDTMLIDSGYPAARAVNDLLARNEMRNRSLVPGVRFLVTDVSEHFASVGESFFGMRMETVERITL